MGWLSHPILGRPPLGVADAIPFFCFFKPASPYNNQLGRQPLVSPRRPSPLSPNDLAKSPVFADGVMSDVSQRHSLAEAHSSPRRAIPC
jgi:hypothetical protein